MSRLLFNPRTQTVTKHGDELDVIPCEASPDPDAELLHADRLRTSPRVRLADMGGRGRVLRRWGRSFVVSLQGGARLREVGNR